MKNIVTLVLGLAVGFCVGFVCATYRDFPKVKAAAEMTEQMYCVDSGPTTVSRSLRSLVPIRAGQTHDAVDFLELKLDMGLAFIQHHRDHFDLINDADLYDTNSLLGKARNYRMLYPIVNTNYSREISELLKLGEEQIHACDH